MKLDPRFEQVAGAPISILRDALPEDAVPHVVRELAALTIERGRTVDRSVDSQNPIPVAFQSRFVQYVERAPWVPELLRIPGLGEEKLDPFQGVVGVLAGHCAAVTGVVPEIASMNLFRDGDDYLSWHVDSLTLGPKADELFVATYSFGAERLLGFRRIGEAGTHAMIGIPTNSLYVMDPGCQREFMHALPRGFCEEQRISVAFFVRQQDSWRVRPWIVVSLTEGILHVGTFAEALERIVAWEAEVEAMSELERERLELQLATRAMEDVRAVLVQAPTGEMLESSRSVKNWAFARGFTDEHGRMADEEEDDAQQKRLDSLRAAYAFLGDDVWAEAAERWQGATPRTMFENMRAYLEGVAHERGRKLEHAVGELDDKAAGETTALARVDTDRPLAKRRR